MKRVIKLLIVPVLLFISLVLVGWFKSMHESRMRKAEKGISKTPKILKTTVAISCCFYL